MRSISKLSKGNVFAVIFSASFAAFHKYFGKVHSGKARLPAFYSNSENLVLGKVRVQWLCHLPYQKKAGKA